MNNENITPYSSALTAADRMKITGSRPAVYWMTGLSGSGKSTIASAFEKKMNAAGHAAMMIDGDTVRTGLCAGLGFSPEGRRENLRRIAELAKITASAGLTVVVCAISPDRESRDAAREIISKEAVFREVYVSADVNVCAERDPKGLYKRAFAGEIKNFTGVSAPYEIPENPDVTLDSASVSAEECAAILFADAEEVIFRSSYLLHEMIKTAVEASEAILGIYNGDYSVSFKEDSSPLTTADIASNRVITESFRKIFPEYSILSEEETDSTERLYNNAGVFIVDPLDGTKEFISRNGEFCVSIGFASRGRMAAGVIAVPALGLIYYAFEGRGAYRMTFEEFGDDFTIGDGTRLHVSDRYEKVIAAASRSHGDEETARMLERNADRILDTLTAGSCLKGCRIAEGEADVHYRFGSFMKEWDTAAMQIICTEAGASFTRLDGTPIIANRADPVNRGGFRILNRPESALIIE